MKEMNMNEMMEVNGGYLAPSERPGTPSFRRDNNIKEANSFARTIIVAGSTTAISVVGKVPAGKSIATGVIARVADHMLSNLN